MKRDTDDWDQMAERLKEGIVTRAAERGNPGTCTGSADEKGGYVVSA